MRLLLIALAGAALVVQWPRRPRAEAPDVNDRPAQDSKARPQQPRPPRGRRFRRRPRRKEQERRAREVFAVLQMQTRLSTLAATLQRIETDADMFARQHHWRTTLWAYDSLLADACAMAGLEVRVAPAGPKADAERLRRELDLFGRGWNW